MDRTKIIDRLSSIGCLTVVLLFVGCQVRSCYQSRQHRLEMERMYEIEKRERHIQDSIHQARWDSLENDPQHQERLRVQDSIYKSGVVVLTCETDSLYHTTTFCMSEYVFDMESLNMYKSATQTVYKPTTQYEAERLGLKYCEKCYSIESVYQDFEDGELMDADQAIEYAKENGYTDEW